MTPVPTAAGSSPRPDSDNAARTVRAPPPPRDPPVFAIVDVPEMHQMAGAGQITGSDYLALLRTLRATVTPGRPASRRAEVPLFGLARRLHIEPTMFAYLNGTATPTAVLGEDLSGSIPVGSAHHTRGNRPCARAGPDTQDTPVTGRARRRKFD